MGLPADYVALLERLAAASSAYEARMGAPFILVGGGAVAIYTQGMFMSGDLDLYATDDDALDASLRTAGFVRDDRVGRFRLCWTHPDHAGFGVECISGSYFDGNADRSRIVRVVLEPDNELALPTPEDLIADRLGQHAVASPSDSSRLRQAQALHRVAPRLDTDYLLKRIADEGGDARLLEDE